MGRKTKSIRIAEQIEKIDGWKNALTDLDMSGRDKQMSAYVVPDLFTNEILEYLYESDDIAARIVDRLPEEMVREGIEIRVDDDPELTSKAYDELKRHAIDEKLEDALKRSRLYGGAGILVGIDNQKPEEPLQLDNVPKISFFKVLDKTQIDVDAEVNKDLNSPNFGFPEYYKLISPDTKTEYSKFHYSRFIRFDGVPLPHNIRLKNNNWGDSIFVRLYNVIRNLNTSNDAVAALIPDFTPAVLKLKNLHEILASGEDELLRKRLELVMRTISNINAIVLNEDETYERQTTNVSGLADLLKMINNRLVAATDMPHSLLLGESPGASLGEGGQSQTKDWYDHVKNKQESILRPVYTKILDLIFSEKNGISKGQKSKYSFQFIPLWQMDEKEKAEIRKIMAEADGSYIDRAVITPEEIAKSRFGESGFSVETILDFEARGELDNTANAEM